MLLVGSLRASLLAIKNLLSKKMIFKISKLKIIDIRQRNAFSIKNGMFLISYKANSNFLGIPVQGKLKLSGKFPTPTMLLVGSLRASLLAIKKVNVARIARNVEGDFFSDFQTPLC